MMLFRAKVLRLAVGVAVAFGLSQALMPAAYAAVTNVPDKTASFNGRVRAVAYHNGVIYIGGAFTAAIQNGQSIPRNHVAAIDERTGTVLPWNPNTNGEVWALAVTDSATYLGGNFGRVGGAAHANIASVATAGTGSVNAQFIASATSGGVKALTVNGSSVYAGGSFKVADGHSKPFLAAFDSQTGGLRNGFNAVADDTVRALSAANGRVYVGGEFNSMNGLRRGRYLAALDPTTGALATGWNSPVGYRIMNIAPTSTNVYAAGDGSGGHLVAASLSGAAQWVVTADGGFQAVTVLGGTIYAGGHFGNVCSTSRTGDHGACLDGQVKRQKMAAFTVNGTMTSWAPQANSPLGTFSMAADQSTGRLAAGGAFTAFGFGSISQPYFAQFG